MYLLLYNKDFETDALYGNSDLATNGKDDNYL